MSNQFDERQLKIRGDIYKRGFTYVIVLLLINAFLEDEGIQWADGLASNILIALLPITLCTNEMIVRDVYFTKRRQYLIMGMFILPLLSHLSVGISNLRNGASFLDELTQDGVLTRDGMSLVFDALFTAVVITFAIKKAAERRYMTEE